MQNQPTLPLINRRNENFAVYVMLLVLATIGTVILPTLSSQISALGLLLLFGLVYTFGYRNVLTPNRITLYFMIQTLLIVGLSWLAAPSDAFNLLFFILGLQAMLVLPTRAGLTWTSLLYVIDAAWAIASRGADGLIFSLFNVAAFLFTALLGYALRTAETALRHNQQLLNELQAAQEQVKELAVTAERNRLAREIHDGLGHYLTATTMQVQGAKAVLESSGVGAQAPAALGALGKAETLLQEALADVRRSVAALRTTLPVQHSLVELLTTLAHEHSIPNQVTVQFTVDGAPRSLNPQVEMTLYRVAQEGLTNVHKHAQAEQVTVTLGYEAQQVRLTIVDDGQGCATTHGGYGLLGLRERVQLVGGTVNIHTAPGQGFALAVVIPVSQ